MRGKSVRRRGRETMLALAIEKMTICEWHGSAITECVVSFPAWEDVEAAVRALDNSSFNDVYLHPSAADLGTYLCIGGGAGRYVVTGSISNEVFQTFLDPDLPPDPQEALVVGGQEGLYAHNWVHNLEDALCATRAFYLAGSFETTDIAWTGI